jgi:hypothetical protein
LNVQDLEEDEKIFSFSSLPECCVVSQDILFQFSHIPRKSDIGGVSVFAKKEKKISKKNIVFNLALMQTS